jgi:ribosomal protein S18 acetylase RimI-like enzyme
MKLTKSKKEELKEISKIYSEEFSKPPYNENWTEEKAIKAVEDYFKNYDLYTIKADDEIVGFISVNPNFMCPGEVVFGEEIAIKESFQNKGIGTTVFKEIFKIYKEKGFKRFLGIVNVDSKAKELYKRLGIIPSKKDILIEKELK